MRSTGAENMKKRHGKTECHADGRCPDCGETLNDGTCRQCAEGWAYLHYQRSLGERYNGRVVTEDS